MKQIYYRIRVLLIFSCVMGSIVACSEDKSIHAKLDTAEATLKVILPKLSNVGRAETRAAQIDEYKINDIDLLVIDKFNKLLYHSKGKNLVDQDPNGEVKQFNIKLLNSSNVKLLVIANAGTELANLNLVKGYAVADLMDNLTFDMTGRWQANNPIPMWGISESINITDDTHAFPTIKLMWSVAGVDVGLRLEGEAYDIAQGLGTDFVLKEVSVYNSYNKGSVVPNLTYYNTSTGKVSKPTVPAGSTVNAPLSWDVNSIEDGKSLLGGIYIPEHEAGADSDRGNAPFVIVGGSYKGGPISYFRLDFLTPPPTTLEGQRSYLSLLRNHRYVFNIYNVSSDGYATKEEAIRKRSQNMQVNTVFYDEETTSISYDDNYMLAIANNNISVSYKEQKDYKIRIYTDEPDGWKAEIDNTKYPWVTITNGAGPSKTFSYIVLNIAKVEDDKDRTAEIKVTCGRLVENIRLTQEELIEFEDQGLYIVSEDQVDVDVNNGSEYEIGLMFENYNNSGWLTRNDNNKDKIIIRVPWMVPEGNNVDIFRNRGMMAKAVFSIPYEMGGSAPVLPYSIKVEQGNPEWITVDVINAYTSSFYDFQVTRHTFVVQFNLSANLSSKNITNYNTFREALLKVKIGKYTAKIPIMQNYAFGMIPKGNYNVFYNKASENISLEHALIMTAGDQESRHSWYSYANVAEGNDFIDDPLNHQVAYGRSRSCESLNRMNYLGYDSGWRLPNVKEAKLILEYFNSKDYWGQILIVNKDDIEYNISRLGTSETSLYGANSYVIVDYRSRVTSVENKKSNYGVSFRCVRVAPEFDHLTTEPFN